MNDNEIWKPVPGYHGFYEVSNEGRVRSIDRTVVKAGRKYRFRGKLLSPFVDTNGYPHVSLYDASTMSKRTVHTLVLEAFVGPRPDGMEACHKDGCRTNSCLNNLRWDTPSSNWDDKRKHGRATQGEHAPRAKLTPHQVNAILKSKESSRVLGERFGVASSTIRAIRIGQNWKHISRETA